MMMSVITLVTDVFWEFDTYADHYTSCRSYLELPKRVEILNHRLVLVVVCLINPSAWFRLDIMKDLYDMLNQELTIEVRD